MAWPTPQDYQEALQNPARSLADPELQAGRIELDSLGLPKPRTGSYASVYRVHCGQRDWAVRCFLWDVPDQQDRYAAISNHLATIRLPYLTAFTFQAQGIKVKGYWYPILKMEWIEGERLDRYIENRLTNQSVLLSLAEQWVEMTKALQQHSIAHGDLQHGNVLVTNGLLRLVDYDGMFVPSMRGRTGNENGHRNYRHPDRSLTDFGPYQDNFSAWSVYVSLIALSVDPTLWTRFQGGDESLLFRETDYKQPVSSALLRELEASRDGRIQSAARLFKSLMSMEPQHVPALDGQVAALSPTPKASHPSWLEDYVKPTPAKGEPTGKPERPETTSATVDTGWIFDFLAPSRTKASIAHFQNSVLPDRALIFVSFCVMLLAPVMVAIEGLTYFAVLAVILFFDFALLRYRYHGEPAVKGMLVLKPQLETLNEYIRASERSIKKIEGARADRQKQADAARARVEAEKKALEVKERRELEVCGSALKAALSAAGNRRRASQQREADELRRIRDDIGNKIVVLGQRLDGLDQAESRELANALKDKQDRFVSALLRQSSLTGATIPGIGSVFKSRLQAAGVRTADDVSYGRVLYVEGIGPQRADALVTWRQNLELSARRIIPHSLSQVETDAIRTKYQGQRATLTDQRNREQRHLDDRVAEVRQRYAPELAQVDAEIRASETKTQAVVDQIKARYASQYAFFPGALAKIDKATAGDLMKLDDDIREARSRLFTLNWELGKQQAELKAFEGVRFSKYLGRVVLGREDAA